MKKIKLMKETFLSIIDASTVHGLPNIFRTTLIILKLIWFLSTTVSVLACAFFILQSINDYLNFDFVTNIESIDDQNLQFPTVSFCSTSFNFDKVLSLQSILKQCYYKNDPDCFYNSNNYFEPYNDTLFRKCYRFNRAINMKDNTTSLPGRTSGLILSIAETKGLKIFIHNYSRKPLDIGIANDLNGNGLFASSGFVTDLTVTKIQSVRLPQPYNDCLKNVNDFTLNKTLINEILRNNESYYQQNCLLKTSFCTVNYKNKFNNKNFVETCSQYCPLECDSVEYQNTYSMVPYNQEETDVYIYFGELKYTLISQQPKTILADLVSNVGGTLGLFLGMSFLSFIEIVEIIFELSNVLFFTKEKNSVSNVSH